MPAVWTGPPPVELEQYSRNLLRRERAHLDDAFRRDMDTAEEAGEFTNIVVRLVGFSIYRGSLTTYDRDAVLAFAARGLLNDTTASFGVNGLPIVEPGDVDSLVDAVSQLGDEVLASPAVDVDESVIERAEAALGVKFPPDYRDIIRPDGLEETFQNADLVLWQLDEVVEINASDAYGVLEALPELLLIGSDGGGELLAYDLRAKEAPVVLVNAVSSSWEEVSPQADTLSELLDALRAGGVYTFT